ncbi:unnamed protein product [Litomosoides sigmodontis]|uniref:Uncharacterized protein n=1 Tax=Litomosoides sigmodontis TaxID=42156 RepID=A0A3P6U5R7_LITSI|nr:unnamed protein product [Litomosoides sigmodontis]
MDGTHRNASQALLTISKAMNWKILFAIYGIVCLAQEVTMELDMPMEYSDIMKQVNMQSAIINNLQRVRSFSDHY